MERQRADAQSVGKAVGKRNGDSVVLVGRNAGTAAAAVLVMVV